MPIVIMSWKTQISVPRRAVGAISAIYSGAAREMAPTAIPITTRPVSSTWADGAIALTNAPMVNKAVVAMMTSRRPTRSATLPADRAPIIAPSRVPVVSSK